MLTTRFAGGLRARPVEARPDRDAGVIFFVTDIHSAKEDEIEAAPDIGLVFIDSNDKAYLSITGRACVTARCSTRQRRPGERPTRYGGRAARTIPTSACCGSSLSRRNCGMDRRVLLVTAFEFAKARLTGEEPKLGENRKVTVKM